MPLESKSGEGLTEAMSVDEKKAIGQFRLQLNGAFRPFTGKVNYGQDVFVPQAIEEIIKLALLLHRRLNGEDIPIEK